MNKQSTQIKSREKRLLRILAALLALCMLLTAQPGLWDGVIAQAAEVVKSGTCGDNLTWTLDADGVLTISGTGAMKDYTDNNSVSISNENLSPFCEDNNIKTVVIEKGVTSIGKCAFYKCKSLTAVTIPEGLTSIGIGAFLYCSALENVAMPKNMTSIGLKAFFSCEQLKSIEIPAGVERIENHTFAHCESLTAVTVPDSVTSIGYMAFINCPLRDVTIPTGVTSIGDQAFSRCALTRVTIPAGVASIGYCAFENCSDLSIVTFQGTTTIPTLSEEYDHVFDGCSFVTKNTKGIRIPSSQYLSSYLDTDGWPAYEAYIDVSHPHDGGVTFDKVLPASGGELESGNYYLSGDVALENFIEIPSGAEVNLCLNGHTLYGHGNSAAIALAGTLNVYDCSGEGVLNGDSKEGNQNNAVSVSGENATLNLHSGKLTGSSGSVIQAHNTVNLLGGIVEGGRSYPINNTGTVTISGDAVVSGGNAASTNCAVMNNSKKAVLTVKDNASLLSEGNGVISYGTVNIKGGTITGKCKDGYGIVNKATLNITGGTVTGDAYGVRMDKSEATMYLSDSPSVSGKKAALYLQTGTDATLDNAKVDVTGYTGATLAVEEASPDGKEGSYAIKTAEGNKDKFPLTNSGWRYLYKDGGLVLTNHTHSYTYAADGAVITESCTCGHEETATLSLQIGSDLTYTGSAVKPVTVTYSDGWVGTGENKPDGSKITYTNNINAGTATATLTISGKTARTSFTIFTRDMDGAAVTLESGTLIYNGQEQTKGVSSVTVNGRTLIEGTDYTISGNKGTNAGTYTLTITGKGNYTGTIQKTFEITMQTTATEKPEVTAKPEASEKPKVSAKPEVSDKPEVSRKEQEKNALSLNAKLKVSQPGKKINIAWGKVSGADGYDIYVQYCGNKFTIKSITAIKSGKTTKVTVKKVNGKPLNLKKNYKIYVLAYKLAGGKKVTLGKTVIAHIVGRKNTKYTNVKAVKVKKRSYSLKKGKKATIKARTVLVSPSKKQLTNAHAKQFRYASTNKKVATVSAKGKIRAVGKGSCIIYVYARNGYAKKIKVKVK